MVAEVANTKRAGRFGRNRTVGCLAVENFGQSAVNLLLLRLDSRCGKHQRTHRQEFTFRFIDLAFALRNRTQLVTNRPFVAFPDAIEAGYAAAVVDGVLFRVDARSLAVTGAQAARVAFFH